MNKLLFLISECVVHFGVSLAFGGELAEAQRLAPKYKAVAEVRLWDATRVDLLSDDYAYEVEWAAKHYQAPGQAVWYSIVSGRKPAVILLVNDPVKEARHIYRCTAVCVKLGIPLHIEQVENTELEVCR